MNVGLHDADKTNFPNLVLMKLSAWHKEQRNSVSMYSPDAVYDIIYSSKVFTYTSTDILPSNTEKGGSGYCIDTVLPDAIEHTCPDYSLYGLNYSMGFLTRGCHRHCSWCIVPKKEGNIKLHADITEFTRHKKVVLLDNNILSSSHGISQLEKIRDMGLTVDFNQGIDARLIDDGIAKLFSKIKWDPSIRLACDIVGQIPVLRKAIELLRWHNVTPRRYFCYVLVKDVDDAIEIVKFLKGMNVDPFAQPYISTDNNIPTQDQKHFARWVNMKAEFKSRTWEDYKEAHL